VDWSEDDKRTMGVACCGVKSLDGETWLAVDSATALAACRGIADHGINLSAEQHSELQQLFDSAHVLVSFNGGDEAEAGFDNVVLAGAGITVDLAKCFDLRLQLKRANGGTLPKGCSLDAIAKANLGYGKTGSGADAPAGWAAGKYREVAEYCLHGDVALTIELYRLWQKQGYLLLPDGTKSNNPTGQGGSSAQRSQIDGTTKTEPQQSESEGGDSAAVAKSGSAGASVAVPGAGRRSAGFGVGTADGSGAVDLDLTPESDQSRKSKKAKVNSHQKSQVVDIETFRPKVNSHSADEKWKKSRVKVGDLIKRIKGYDIVESEYGVSYLFVISRKPEKKTSADFTIYEHAGFSTWRTLENNGRVKRGESSEGINRNRNWAS